MRTPGTNLLAEYTRFVGRADDLAALADWHRGPLPVLTVVGPGGVGKTRLARQWAAALASGEAPAGGVWFCELSEARTESELLAAVGGVLGVALTLGAEVAATRAQLGHALAARGPVLLVLDNCEPLGPRAAAALDAWCAAAPGARFLATSRAPLGCAGEARHVLEALPEADAVALLEDRAHAARSGRSLAAPERALAATLAQRLDGLPLAIELAAARLDVLSVADVLARLAERFAVLRRFDAAPHDRHAALWATIDASWRLLTDAERAALAQCAVFRGGFTARAAEAVVRLPPGAPALLDVLQSLHARSLLRRLEEAVRPDVARVGFYENIQSFAAEQLAASGGADEAHARHAAHYLAEAERHAARVNSAEEAAALDALAQELGNLVAAHRWALAASPAVAARIAVALHPLLLTRGPFDVHHELVDAAVTAADGAGDVALRARARLARGELYFSRGRLREARGDLDAALALAASAGDEDARGVALRILSRIERVQGRPEESAARARDAVEIHRRSGARAALGLALLELSGLGLVSSRPQEARPHAEEALAAFRELGARRLEALALNAHGFIARLEGRLEDALRLNVAALAIHREVGNRRSEFVELINAASLEHNFGRLAEADALFDEASARVREYGDRVVYGQLLTIRAALDLELERFDVARDRLEEALSIHSAQGHRLHLAQTRYCQGCVALECGELTVARGHLAQALADVAAAHNEELEGAVLRVLGGVHAREGELGAAEDAWRRAREALAPFPNPDWPVSLGLFEGLGELLRARRADAAGDRAVALQRLEAVRARLAASHALAGRSPEVRISARIVARELAATEAALTTGALRIGAEARTVQLPDGARIALPRQRPLRLILLALAEARLRTPGRALPLEAIIAAGWPGQRLLHAAATNRAYVSLARLRALGLRAVLLTRDDGFLLDPAVTVVTEPVE